MPTVERNRDEMVRLAAFLRQHPDSLTLGVPELAARAQTSEDVVRKALASPDRHKKASKSEDKPRQPRFSAANLLDRLFAHPLWFVGITFALAILTTYLIPDSAQIQSQANQTTIQVNEALEIIAFVLAMILHMVCYAWRGLSRFALYGALLVGVSGTAIAVVAAYVKNPVPNSPLLPLIIGVAVIMSAIFYAIIGVGCSSLGAYVRFRREEATMRQRSRQELLQRLFEIEEALRMPLQTAEVRRFAWPWLDRVRSRIFLYAAVVGFGLSITMSASTIVFPGPTASEYFLSQAESKAPSKEAATARANALSKVSPGFFVCQFIFGASAILLQLGLAYLAGRPVRAMLVSLVCGYASTIATLLPIGTMGYQWILGDDLRWGAIMKGPFAANIISGTLLAILFGLFAGTGAYVEDRAHQARLRTANDPSMLLSEFVQIQRSLNSASQTKCVIVVDAAKSSLMKSNADPLVAEWSFRAYQQFLAEIVRDCHGRIYSTAGDGAMAAFDRAEDAFLAARTIQTKVAEFNSYVSRLKDPFRLRIGIHCGEVSGDLDEVEFTEVLDIAAHVEAASQVGGIAVTASIAEELSTHRFAEIQETIDGHRVFLALNPTLDPRPILKTLDLGVMEYLEAWERQKVIVQAVMEGEEDTLIFVEHPPVLTLGANFHEENLLLPLVEYEARGITIHRTDRGGDVTYHGPGQLVIYPIFNLEHYGKDLHRWMRGLEQTMIDTCEAFGVPARRFAPHTGAWVNDKKIAAIGVKIKRWVSMHGIALNCANDLDVYELFVPCGIRGYGVTSLSAEASQSVSVEDAKRVVIEAFHQVFGSFTVA